MPTGDSTPVSIPEISSELELEKNHAQFFGYRVEEIQSNLITLTPASSNRMTWWWLIKRGHGVLARRGYCPYNGQISRQDCLEFCNKINVRSELITAKLEKDEDGKENIFIESFLEGQYSRSTFSIFLERINQEFYEALTQEDIDEIASRLIDTEDDDED